MAKKFFPELERTAIIDASKPHPDKTQYKISIGLENWNGTYHNVVKVQMVYDGNVSGRRSPSYPLGSDDAQRVFEKINELSM
jgi:hypothetical protein